MRVERTDPAHVSLITNAGEAVVIPNVEFVVMRQEIQRGAFHPDLNERIPRPSVRSSAARIRT